MGKTRKGGVGSERCGEGGGEDVWEEDEGKEVDRRAEQPVVGEGGKVWAREDMGKGRYGQGECMITYDGMFVSARVHRNTYRRLLKYISVNV